MWTGPDLWHFCLKWHESCSEYLESYSSLCRAATKLNEKLYKQFRSLICAWLEAVGVICLSC